MTSPSDELFSFCLDHELRDIRLTRNDAFTARIGGSGTHSGTYAPGTSTRRSSSRKYVCPCCGMSVRATREVRIGCMDCEEQLVLAG